MIEQVIESHQRDLGGFSVERVLPQATRRMVGPFVFLDHMGPKVFERGFAKSADVRPHPHIGLSTVTYLFKGEITHRDSVGSEVEIQPGEVNWMTAGRGITHSERFDRLRDGGGTLHGIQAWVALPVEDEETDPRLRPPWARRPADSRRRQAVGAAYRRRGFPRQGRREDPFADVLRALAAEVRRARPAQSRVSRAGGLHRQRRGGVGRPNVP